MSTPSNRVEKLIKAMILEDKVSLMDGASMWLTNPVERLGIPVIKVTDGPNGARRGLVWGGEVRGLFPRRD